MARASAVLPVLVCLAGCAPADSIPEPGTTSSGESSSGGAEPTTDGDAPGDTTGRPDLPGACAQYLDETAGEAEVRITNGSATEIYLFDVDGCGTIESVWQLQTEDDGFWPTPCGPGMTACEGLLGLECSSPWCDLACRQRGGIRLLPGATYVESFPGLTRVPIRLPSECTGECDEPQCRRARALIDAEAVGVAVAMAASEPTCVMGSPCACEPGPDGWCETPVAAPETEIDEVVLQGSVAGASVSVTFAP